MKRRIKICYNAPVTLSFVFLCLLVTIIGLFTDNRSILTLFGVYRCSLKEPLGYIRVFTHVLGHTDIEHFIANAMYLLLLGPLLEEKYSSKLILKTIIITAFITGLFHCILFENVVLCGQVA